MIANRALLAMIVLSLGLALVSAENNIRAEDILNKNLDKVIDCKGLKNVSIDSENWAFDDLNYVNYQAYYDNISNTTVEHTLYAIRITLSSTCAIEDVELYKNGRNTDSIPSTFWTRPEQKLAHWIKV